MASLNKVFLIGNLTRDPELRYTPQGSAVCEFGLAINRKFTGSDGSQKEDVCFLDINVWGQQAETCNRYLQKGALVFIEGRLQMDSWEDKESGAKRSKIRVVAEKTQFLTPKGGGGRGQAGDGSEMADDEYSQAGDGAQQQQRRSAPQQQRRPQAPPPPPKAAGGPPPMPKPEPEAKEIFEPDASQEDNIPF